jgi:hypothetical protein
MPNHLAIPLDREGIAPRPVSPRLRSQLNYFMAAPGSPGVPELGAGEYWFDPASVAGWLDDGVIELVSPLDTANMTEVELSEEQEDFLTWLRDNDVRHVRVTS